MTDISWGDIVLFIGGAFGRARPGHDGQRWRRGQHVLHWGKHGFPSHTQIGGAFGRARPGHDGQRWRHGQHVLHWGKYGFSSHTQHLQNFLKSCFHKYSVFWPSKPLAWLYLYFRLRPVEWIYCPIETIKEDLWP